MTIDKKLLEQLYKDKTIINPDKKNEPVERILTPSPSFNWMLQGGLVEGKFYMPFGPESSGKSMYTVAMCAAILKKNPDKVIYWFDAEKSFTDHWVNIFMSDELGFTEFDRKHRIVKKPVDFGRDVFDYYTETVLARHDSGLQAAACVLDSLQALIPPNEETRDSTEDALMGPLARYLPGAIRSIVTPSRERNISWFFISQVREVFSEVEKRMGKKFNFSGGKAALHLIDCLILFEQIQGSKAKILDPVRKGMDEEPVQIGANIRARVLNKSRVGAPNRISEFGFLYNKGIIKPEEEIAMLALNLGFTRNDGKSYFYKEKRIGLGYQDYVNNLAADPALTQEIYNLILKD